MERNPVFMVVDGHPPRPFHAFSPQEGATIEATRRPVQGAPWWILGWSTRSDLKFCLFHPAGLDAGGDTLELRFGGLGERFEWGERTEGKRAVTVVA